PYWPENGGGISAPTSGPTNIWEGSEFWLQFRVKISSTRWASGNVSGKLAFVNTMALTGTQEILIRSCANPDSAAPLSFNQTNPFLLYTSQGNEANSVIFQTYQGTDSNNGVIIEGGPTSPFPATCTIGNQATPGACWEYPSNQWTTILLHVIPGRNNDAFAGQVLANWPFADTTIEAWKCDIGETEYTQLFS